MRRQKCSNILQLPASHDLTDERWCLSSSYKVITFLHFLNIHSIYCFFLFFRHWQTNSTMRRQQPTLMGDQREVARRTESTHIRGQEQKDIFTMRRIHGQEPPPWN